MLSEKEFNEIFETYKNQVYRYSYTFTLSRDSSLDICQDVFMVVYKKCPSDKEKLQAWIYKVTKNKCIDYLRKNKHIVKTDIDSINSSNSDIDMLYYINKLPDKYKDVIKMYYYLNLQTKTCAKVLSITEDAFKKRLQRAREMLKEMIGDSDEA